MGRCWNCDTGVDGTATYCPNCGSALEDRTGESPATGQGSKAPPPGQAQGPRRGHNGRGERAAMRETGSGSASDSSVREESQSGLTRRRLLAGAGSVVALGGAGWYVFLREDGSDQDGPKRVLAESWQTWEEGDIDAYRDLWHSESPERDEEYWNDPEYWAEFGRTDQVEWTIEEREVINKTDSRAYVREVYVWENTTRGSRWRFTEVLQLRTEDGEWHIYSWSTKNQTQLADGSTE